jgi:hypothetical protein
VPELFFREESDLIQELREKLQMADRSKYVDIFFRNGLKEFEVLPPPDVWENIQPVLRKKERSLNLYRLVAVATILISLSGFSYWITSQISDDFRGPAISLNQESIPDGSYLARNNTVMIQPVRIPIAISRNTETIIANEPRSEEINSLKIVTPALLSVLLNENKAGRSIKPVFSYSEISMKAKYSGIEQNIMPDLSKVTEKQNAGINRWSLSAMASPNYYSSFNSGKSQASSDLSNAEKSLVSYSGGMEVSYKLNKRVSIQSGLFYSSIGKEVTGIGAFSGFNKYYNAKGGSEFSVQTSNGTIVATNSDIYLRDNVASRVTTRYSAEVFDPSKANLAYIDNSINQSFNYLEIPVMFKYKAIDRKIDVTLVGGLSYNMLVGNSAYANVDGVKYSIGKTEGLSPVNFSSSVGLGFEYDLSRKISFNLEPTFRYYLTPLNDMAGSSGHPFGFGVFTGLSYKF